MASGEALKDLTFREYVESQGVGWNELEPQSPLAGELRRQFGRLTGRAPRIASRADELREAIAEAKARLKHGKDRSGQPFSVQVVESEKRWIAELQGRLQALQQPHRRKGEVGSLFPESGEGVFEKPREEPYAFSNEALENQVRASLGDEKVPLGKKILGQFNAIVHGMKNKWQQATVFAPHLLEHPSFRYDTRLLKDAHMRELRGAQKDIVNALGPLVLPGEPKWKIEVLNRLLPLRSIVEGIEKGKWQTDRPLGLTAEELKAQLTEMEARVTPEIEAAADRFRDLMRREAELMVAEGRLPKEVLDTENYYHLDVLDFANNLGRRFNFPTVYRERKQPWRYALHGTERAINWDIIDVNLRYLLNVRLARRYENHALKWLNHFDMMPYLSDAQRKAIGKPHQGRVINNIPSGPNEIKLPGDWVFYAYRRFGNQRYIESTPFLDSITTILSHVYPDEVEGVLTTGKHRYYLVPRAIGEEAMRIYAPKEMGDFERQLNVFMSLWKRTLIDALGLPFHSLNAAGDEMVLLLLDPQAFARQLPFTGEPRKILKIIRMMQRPDMSIDKLMHDASMKKELEAAGIEPEFLRILWEEDIIGSGLFGTELGQRPDYRLAVLRGEISRAREIVAGWLNNLEALGEVREAFPRTAKALTDYKRLQAGEDVYLGPYVKYAKGLSKRHKIGVVAREPLTDYRGQAKGVDRVRGHLFPFIPWALNQLRFWPMWARHAIRNEKGKFLAVATFAGLVWYWNNKVHKEQEGKLPEYIRRSFHLNTGRQSKDGEEMALYMPMPWDIPLNLFGISRANIAIQDWRMGKIGNEELWRDIFKAPFQGFADMALGWSGPVASIPISLLVGYDVRNNRSIIKSWHRGSPELERRDMQWFVFGNLAIPFGLWEQWQRRAERDPDILGKHGVERFLAVLQKGPLDWRRALGYMAVDPVRTKQHEAFHRVRMVEAKYVNALNAVAEAYVESEATGKSELFARAREKAHNGGYGIRVRDQDIQRFLDRPAIRAWIHEKKASKARTPAEKRVWKKEAERYRTKQIKRNLQSYPAAVRREVLRKHPDLRLERWFPGPSLEAGQ